MAIHVDPEGNEVRALQRAVDWRGRRVLEVGCGEGRLTRRLARLGARVEAIEQDPALVRLARLTLPPSFAPRVRFRVGTATRLAYPAESFDVVVHSWVL